MNNIRVYEYGGVLIVSTQDDNILLGVIDRHGLFTRMNDITIEQRIEINALIEKQKQEL